MSYLTQQHATAYVSIAWNDSRQDLYDQAYTLNRIAWHFALGFDLRGRPAPGYLTTYRHDSRARLAPDAITRTPVKLTRDNDPVMANRHYVIQLACKPLIPLLTPVDYLHVTKGY